jgi:hypothetical protein
MKRIKEIHNLIESNEFTTKIKIFFSTKEVPAHYDSYEQSFEYTNLNPQTIKGIVRELSGETLVWRQYGLHETGAVEIIVSDKYKTWFELCTKVEINSDSYSVFKDTAGSRALIQRRSNNLLRVILQKI